MMIRRDPLRLAADAEAVVCTPHRVDEVRPVLPALPPSAISGPFRPDALQSPLPDKRRHPRVIDERWVAERVLHVRRRAEGFGDPPDYLRNTLRKPVARLL